MLDKKNILGQFLKSSRISAGHSQRDVADQLGYETPQFISNWERGVSHPPINALKKLGELYKISADDLFEVQLNQTIHDMITDLKRKFSCSVGFSKSKTSRSWKHSNSQGAYYQ